MNFDRADKIAGREPAKPKPRGKGRLHIVLGGRTVTVYDGAVHSGVTLEGPASMLVSHDLFIVMEEEVHNGKASQKAKT